MDILNKLITSNIEKYKTDYKLHDEDDRHDNDVLLHGVNDFLHSPNHGYQSHHK